MKKQSSNKDKKISSAWDAAFYGFLGGMALHLLVTVTSKDAPPPEPDLQPVTHQQTHLPKPTITPR